PASGGATVPPTDTSTTTATGGPPPALVPPDLEDIPDPYAWVSQFKGSSPPTIWLQRLAAFDCTPDGTSPGQVDIPSQPLLACSSDGTARYLLGPSMLDGTAVTDASAGIPQGQFNWAVNVNFDGAGAQTFGDVTARIAQNCRDPTLAGSQLAIVLDGKVLSDPVNEAPIRGGSAQITGSSANPFTQTQAQSLANSLKYGALPLSFTVVQDTNEGPELASNQLDAGIVAGIVGLLLVVAYCMLYYRGLGLVVIASLVIAGLITYASVLLLGHGYGFTLTLPGIAGLIVAVGITADSFIVYFERLRDEVRDGRTLRTSVETGWVRARMTILAADAVSMLAAVVLFIFAIGVVKGFAFALGLTTFIDVFVVFFFTKPVVTLLSRTTFFGQGHKWSGLDRQHLGMPPLTRTPRSARGET
ncbi:MAG: preprotein translocase subunit SecD, partial [Pseudonocardiales bacterium]|nr:preprotein translocase subunit SecD [Pseudonocardiales bacterium]